MLKIRQKKLLRLLQKELLRAKEDTLEFLAPKMLSVA